MKRFQPVYVEKIWGARRLAERFERKLPEGLVGESWELVDFAGNSSLLSHSSEETLHTLWQQGALGGSAKGEFPFLLKWIDTSQKLSLQVHPDAETCAKLTSDHPKTEAWFVAHVEPTATMFLGHYPGLTPELLKQAIKTGSLEKWLYEFRARQGDMILVPAGTLHAVGAGYTLLEVQQPSESTFRIYDWGRVDAQGLPRPLMIEEAAQAIHFSRSGPLTPVRTRIEGPHFKMQRVEANTMIEHPERLRVLVAALGPVVLKYNQHVETLALGETIVAEPSDGIIQIENNACVLLGE